MSRSSPAEDVSIVNPDEIADAFGDMIERRFPGVFVVSDHPNKIAELQSIIMDQARLIAYLVSRLAATATVDDAERDKPRRTL